MSEKHIPYVERDITQDTGARKTLISHKIMGVPAFEVNGQFIVGLDTQRIEEALKHQVFPCPNCGQQLRTPIVTGKLKINCPNCSHQFIKE